MNYFSFLKNRRNILFLASGFVIAILIPVVLYSFRESNKITKPPSPTPVQSTSVSLTPISLTLEKITPSEGTTLSPGNSYIFTASFTTSVELNQVEFNLLAIDEADQQSSSVQLTSDVIDEHTLYAKTSSDIQPWKSYRLTITNKTTNQILFTTLYLTEHPIPTRVPSNDNALSTYLPYQTKSFSLTYSQPDNIYVFNFIYNPDSSLTYDDQYANAKSEAIKFIQSKGINVSTIIIDWRSS